MQALTNILTLAVAAVAAVVLVVACQTAAPAPKRLTTAAAPTSAGKLEVRHTGGATYSLTRLDLVGTRLLFDMTATYGSTKRTRRFAVQLGGSSNAWVETREAIKLTITGVSPERFTLWTSPDADQWWDSPLAAEFMQSISTARVEQLP